MECKCKLDECKNICSCCASCFAKDVCVTEICIKRLSPKYEGSPVYIEGGETDEDNS
jgi:hypothetical protein